MRSKIKTIAFDADDTLWVNLPHFLETEDQFCSLLAGYLPASEISRELFNTEMKNLKLYGYGVKGFMLCMIETILRVSDGKAGIHLVEKAISLGQDLLQRPVELLDGVETTLQQLQGRYRLVLATKGDLLDQERKLQSSGLEGYFHHIEIMSDKKAGDYRKLLKHLDCQPEHFLMLGNSLKSDVLPVLELGGYAAHIPYHTTWQHEEHHEPLHHPNFLQLNHINEVLDHLD